MRRSVWVVLIVGLAPAWVLGQGLPPIAERLLAPLEDLARLKADRRVMAGEFPENEPLRRDISTLPPIAPTSIPPERREVRDDLARLVPVEFFFLRCHSIETLRELDRCFVSEGLDSASMFWPGPARRNRLRERYEQQLMLDGPGNALGGLIVGEMAVIGSDFELASGADVTVLLRAKNAVALRLGLSLPIATAKTRYGPDFAVSKTDIDGQSVEGYSTPDRQISSYRTEIGDVFVISNSLAAVRQVIAASQGRRVNLLAANDFRLIRQSWPAGPSESALVFFSDAFLREQFGPKGRIGTLRRRIARAGLAVTAEDYLVAKSAEIAKHPQFNTLAFTTPRLEMPIEQISEREARMYEAYYGLTLRELRPWLAPVAFRLNLLAEQVRVEVAYLAPKASPASEWLRLRFGGIPRNPEDAAVQAFAQLAFHIAPTAPERSLVLALLQKLGLLTGLVRGLDWAGDEAFLRLEAGPGYAELAEVWLSGRDWPEFIAPTTQIPWVGGMAIRKPIGFMALLTAAHALVRQTLREYVTWDLLVQRGMPGGRITLTANGLKALGVQNWPAGRPFPTVHYTAAEGWFLFGSDDLNIRRQLDRLRTRRDPRLPAGKEAPIVGACRSPVSQAGLAEVLVRQAAARVERQTAEVEAVWAMLRATGRVREGMSVAEREQAALASMGSVPAASAPKAFEQLLRSWEQVRWELHLPPDRVLLNLALVRAK